MSQHRGANQLQARLRTLLRPVFEQLWTLELDGFERLPEHGPAILCPNHISFIDSPFLMASVPRNISFVGKAEYLDDWKTKHLFPALGMIPIDRSGGNKSEGALSAARRVLERGELFGIYPEGTRSRDGNLYKGRTGAARLSMATGAPIYPVGIIGTDLIQPVDSVIPKIGRSATIRIGRPIKPERYAHRGPEHMSWRSMIDEVMFEIRELSGQRYCNHYAGDDPSTKPSKVASVGDAEVGSADATQVERTLAAVS